MWNSSLHVTVNATQIRKTTPGMGLGGCRGLEELGKFES